MKQLSRIAGCGVAASVLVALATSTVLAAPRLATGPDAEVTFDGLHRVEKTTMAMAWVKPTINLSGYTKMMVAGAGISYKTVEDADGHWWVGRSNQSEFPISEEAKQRLQTEFTEAFLREIERSDRYEIVTVPGPATLLLVGGLLDVVSNVPPVDECVGRCDVYLTEVGEATLVLELRDSVTNEVLARAADRRIAESAFPIEANRVTVWPEVRRLAQTWARIIRRRLEEFDTVDDF